ncbi:MAG: hypothetical protein JEZ09_12005 [Salinivirgaceae bacterium]|nr:hypothetical protein [Salinivirgaceae bacterium]
MKQPLKHLKNKTTEQLFEIKSKLVELLYWIFLITMWFGLLGTLFRTLDIGIQLINYLQLLMICYMIFIFAIRNKLNYQLKAILLLLTILILAIGGIFSFGLFSQGILFLLLFVILSSVFLDTKWGYISFAISLLAIIIAGFLFINEIITINNSVIKIANAFSGWFMAAMAFSLISIIVIVFWQRVLQHLTSKIDVSFLQEDNLAKINKLLRKEIETRKQTEILLKDQYDDSKDLNERYQKINEELQDAFHNLEKSNLQLVEAKEKAQSADLLKSSFLSNMSHEIRTPLNAIVGFSSLLSNKDITQKEYDNYLSIIRSGTNSLLTTISDITNMAKIEAGDYSLYPEKVELNELLKEIESSLIEKIDQTSLNFNIYTDLPSPCHIITDKQSFLQIITKLIDNALKFTKKGDVNVYCCILSDGSFNIIVKDTGIGITQTIKDEIFETFRQLDNNFKRKHGGTGLGLSIAKGLLDLLNGSIEFSSEPNKGSTFSVTIPIILVNDAAKNISGLNNWKGKTILIIGKEAWENKEINTILHESNAILRYVDSAFQAIDTFKLHPEIDATIMTLNMYDMNTEKFIKIIKQIRPLMPVIAFNTEPNSKTTQIDLCDAALTPPISKLTFLKLMENYLGLL